MKTPQTTSTAPEEILTPQEAGLIGMEKALTELAESFRKSARRWELMVYPAVLLFFIMAVSGFWLIYSLTIDMHTLAQNVDPLMQDNMGKMAKRIEDLSANVAQISGEIQVVADKMSTLDSSVDNMNGTMLEIRTHMSAISSKLDTLPPMLATMSDMNRSMRGMTLHTGVMTRDVSQMNHSVSRPMSFMNAFMPW